jgi:hypothetical protein
VAARGEGDGGGGVLMVSVFLNGPAGIYGLAGPISVRPVGLYRLSSVVCLSLLEGPEKAPILYIFPKFFPSDHPLFDIRATICIY